MSVWSKYPKDQRNRYIDYLKMFTSLSKIFNQKSSKTGIPALNYKYHERIYAMCFNSKEVDINNTPHDIMSNIEGNNIGIGIKTWSETASNYQKVMQLKHYRNTINKYYHEGTQEYLAHTIAKIKNSKLLTDDARLGLSKNGNIYHYVTRGKGKITIHETSYPLIDCDSIQPLHFDKRSFTFKDNYKTYKYYPSDCQIFMYFDTSNDIIINTIHVDIMDNPFEFLKNAFNNLNNENKSITFNHDQDKQKNVTYLPLYSYNSNKVSKKSGLNSFNAAPKSKGGTRPDAETYIPIPSEYWQYHPNWFNENINFRNQRQYEQENNGDSSYSFQLHLPNGKPHKAMICQTGFKSLQTKPQSALGNWLLYGVLGIKKHKQELVTMDKLKEAGYDSVKLWHEDINNPKDVWIDLAPIGSFDNYMKQSKKEIEKDTRD